MLLKCISVTHVQNISVTQQIREEKHNIYIQNFRSLKVKSARDSASRLHVYSYPAHNIRI